MALTALNPEKWMRMAQAFRNKSLVSMAFTNKQFREMLTSGDQINFPYLADLRRQTYTRGTDAEFFEEEATQDSMTIDYENVVTFRVDPADKIQAEADFEAQYAEQAVYQLNNGIDQQMLNTAIVAAQGTVAGGTLSSSTIFSVAGEAKATLRRQNAGPGAIFFVIDPERAALIESSGLANTFNVADSIFRNGFAGSFNGADTYVSNNLPNSVSATLPTNPSNGQVFTLAGVTLTAKTTPVDPGDFDIGATAADTQANLRALINGTGTPGTSTYIELSEANRALFTNEGISCSAFGSDIATITGFNLLNVSTTITGGVVGTETTSLLMGIYGAPSLGLQISPMIYDAKESRRPGVINYMARDLAGFKVFERDKARLVKITINV